MNDKSTCTFIAAEADARSKWTCGRCGFTTPVAHERPPLRKCSEAVVSSCDRLGERVIRIHGDVLDCKHRSIALYECEQYNEAISQVALPTEHMEILVAAADSKGMRYNGRSCDNCKYLRDLMKAKRKVNAVKQPKSLTLGDVTIIVTTFKRPAAIARLIVSLKKFYPRIRRIVVDTGDTKDEKLFANISAGRNRALNSVKTKLTLLLDDDFEFTGDTKIERWLDVLNHDNEGSGVFAGVGGTVIEKNKSYSWCHSISVFRGHMSIRPSNEEWRATPSGVVYRPCDMVINFFLARTEVLRETQWDEDLPLEEHRDIFLRMFNLRKWRWGWTPSVTCLHHRDRDPEYTKYRNRSFLKLAQRKHGLRFDLPVLNGMTKPHVDGLSAHLVGKPDPPTAVIIGVAHSNTTITTKQLEMLGFNLNDADDEYAESVAVRDLNDAAQKSGRLDVVQAKELLRGWSRPWAVKDPRFARGTLPMWIQVFVPYTPILFWLDKSLDDVVRSYKRRGEWSDNVGRLHANCKTYYDAWPWAKYHIKTEQIADACAAFDPERSRGSLTLLSGETG